MAGKIDKMQSNEDTNLGHVPRVFRNKDKDMSDVLYAGGLLREGFPKSRYGKVESIFYEACKFINKRVNKKVTIRRVRSIWEGTAKRIDSEEMDALREAVFEESKREQQELRARLAALDEILASVDANVTRKALARKSERNGRLGRMDRV